MPVSPECLEARGPRSRNMCASFSGVSPVFASEGIGVSTGGRSQSSPSHRNEGTRAASPLAAFAALLVGRQLDDIPVLHNASTVQRVVHAEFWMLQQLLTTLTPMASSVSASGSASSRYWNTPRPAPTGSSC